MRPAFGSVLTFWTGVEITGAAVSVMSRGVLLPASTTVNRVDVPGAAPKSAALMTSTPSCVGSFTKSTPLTPSTRAPRGRPAPVVAAGEPGSTYATRRSRGGERAKKAHCAPYPTDEPAPESAFHSSVV
ncbi:hypothetical protein D3C72_729690 [compost metagenome]